MIPHAGPCSHRELPVRRLWFCTSRVAATPPHLTCCLALLFIITAHLLIAHNSAGQWPLVETLHQGIMARWNDMVMLALVGWPNSVAMAAELWTAGERSLPMLLVPRRQPRSPSVAHVAIEAKS